MAILRRKIALLGHDTKSTGNRKKNKTENKKRIKHNQQPEKATHMKGQSV